LTDEGQLLDKLKGSIGAELKKREWAEKRAMVDPKRRGYWPDHIQSLIDEIDKLLFPYVDYLKAEGSSGENEQASIEELTKAGIPSKIEAQQPAETEAKTGGGKKPKAKKRGRPRKYKAGNAKETIEQAQEQPPTVPDDTITLLVAVADYNVSRGSLKRAIQDGRLNTYRCKKAAKNSPHKVSRAEIEEIWPRR
jgi:hypothetical protein